MEGLGIDNEKLEMLKQFVMLCKFNTSVLHAPKLAFFKDWLVNDLKASVPELANEQGNDRGDGDGESTSRPTYAEAAGAKTAWTKESSSDDSDDESSGDSSGEESSGPPSPLEDEEMEGVIPGDNDPPQEMGDDSKEPTETEQDEAMQMRQLGMEALSNGDNEGAVKHFTAGILLDSTRTVLFVKRATAFVRLKKPNAAIRDAEKALQINPDSAAAYRILGKAQHLLGKWDEACHSFEVSQKIDYDDNIYEMIKEIKPKATKIRERKMAAERKQKERDIKERLNRVRKAKKAQEKAQKEQEEREKEAEEKFRREMPNMPGMFNFAGGMPGGMSGADFMSAAAAAAAAAGAGGKPGETPGPQPAPAAEEEAKIFEVPTEVELD